MARQKAFLTAFKDLAKEIANDKALDELAPQKDDVQPFYEPYRRARQVFVDVANGALDWNARRDDKMFLNVVAKEMNATTEPSRGKQYKKKFRPLTAERLRHILHYPYPDETDQRMVAFAQKYETEIKQLADIIEQNVAPAGIWDKDEHGRLIDGYDRAPTDSSKIDKLLSNAGTPTSWYKKMQERIKKDTPPSL